MKTMNKVIAAMMMMAITTAMPAMAGNKNHTNNDKKDKPSGIIRRSSQNGTLRRLPSCMIPLSSRTKRIAWVTGSELSSVFSAYRPFIYLRSR